MNPTPYPPVDGSEPCMTGDPERFHPEKGGNGHALNKVKDECLGCRVEDLCLAYALTHRVAGIWAGTSTEEREAVRKRDGIRAEPLNVGPFLTSPEPAVPGDHGNYGGVSRHRKRFERNCAACRAFISAESRKQRAARKQAAS